MVTALDLCLIKWPPNIGIDIDFESMWTTLLFCKCGFSKISVFTHVLNWKKCVDLCERPMRKKATLKQRGPSFALTFASPTRQSSTLATKTSHNRAMRNHFLFKLPPFLNCKHFHVLLCLIIGLISSIRVLEAAADSRRDCLSEAMAQQATFAAGCFWSVELAFQRVPGVTKVS